MRMMVVVVVGWVFIFRLLMSDRCDCLRLRRRLWKHFPAVAGGWDSIMRRFQAEEVGFNLHRRQLLPTTPSLSGMSTTAAYGEGAAVSLRVAPLPHEGISRRGTLPQMSLLQETVQLASGLQNGMGGDLFSEEWLVQKVPPHEFSKFLSTLTPSRLLVIVSARFLPTALLPSGQRCNRAQHCFSHFVFSSRQ